MSGAPKSIAVAGACAAILAGCGVPPIVLRPPSCAANLSRDTPTHVEIEPIVIAAGADLGATVAVGHARFAHPGPADVLTTAISSELAARALHGGEAGGYVVHCELQRFAVRSDFVLAASRGTLVLYADAACTVERQLDHAPVWRGMLRGRAAANGTGEMFSTEEDVAQRLTDRVFSDASREMASDLAVRALVLEGTPSERVFTDDHARAKAAGLDDGKFGASALAEDPRAAQDMTLALSQHDPLARASAWNAVAMMSGPGEPLLVPLPLRKDPDAIVRFAQYKALARSGSKEAFDALAEAIRHDDEPMLVEFGRDAIASGGIGVARSRRVLR